MRQYIIRRLLLIVPTLLGIMVINFAIVQFTPGGPVDQAISNFHALQTGGGSRVTSPTGDSLGLDGDDRFRGLDPEIIAEIKSRYGFDEPAMVRFFKMMRGYLTFDFGTSFYSDRSVTELVIEKLPVSISLGVWSTLIIYLISIPLGVAKASRNNSSFDIWTSATIIIGYAIPGFLFAVMLIVFFAGGRYFQWFPLRGLFSHDFSDLSFWRQVLDYFHHLALPIFSLVIGGFATLTLLTKNSFLEEIQNQYVMTARAKGLSERQVLYGHVFRNAMLIIIASFPNVFIGMLFTGALLVEVIFSLDGIGLLGFNAVVNRDYPVFFGTLYFFTLLGLVLNLLSDLVYNLVDPRIGFSSVEDR